MSLDDSTNNIENEKNDKGMQHLENTESARSKDNQYIDPVVAKRIARKFDKHIVPWLFGYWLLAYIDRANIGNAKIDGLQEEVAPVGLQFNTALAIFYVPYILVDVPSNWVLKYFKAGRYLPFMITAWGLCSTFLGFVKSYGGLLAGRFFLGLCEGGLLGGMVLYLSMFYRRHQLLYRIGLFYSAAPLAGAFGGLLASGLGSIEAPGYNGWPFIFFVEGAITVLVGLVSFFFLPHDPESCGFLTADEKSAFAAIMEIDSQMSSTESDTKAPSIAPDKYNSHWIKIALLNWNTQLLSWNFFAIITPIYSYSLFLPTIIKALGYENVIAQLFSVPPNICGFITVLIVAHFSDKYKIRGPFMLAGIVLAIGGYIMLISTGRAGVQYGGTFLVAAGIFPCSPLVMAWLSNNLHPHYVRATGTGYQIGIANLAAFLATFTYLDDDAPRYIAGHAINIGTLVLALVLTTATYMYQGRENAKRDRGIRDHRLEESEEALLGHSHPRFRYTR